MQSEKAAVQARLDAMRQRARDAIDILEPRVGKPLRPGDTAALTRFIHAVSDLDDAVVKLLEALDWEKNQ